MVADSVCIVNMLAYAVFLCVQCVDNIHDECTAAVVETVYTRWL